MDLLQKITLYDLLGYAVPGTLLLWLFKWDGKVSQIKDLSGMEIGSWIVLLAIGYMAGIVISEFMNQLRHLCKKNEEAVKWKTICETYGISEENLRRALHNTGLIKNYHGMEQLYEALGKYKKYIYSDIQTDPVYNRIHNYASARVLYKNMVAVSMAAIVFGLFQCVRIKIIIGVIGAVGFAMREKRFEEKQAGYSLCWFVQKHR